MKPDADTVSELTAAEHIKGVLSSQGWSLIKASLDAKILDLQMIGNVEGSTPEEIVTNMKARSMAVAILFEWLSKDLYGRVEQQDVAKQAMTNENDTGFIARDTA